MVKYQCWVASTDWTKLRSNQTSTENRSQFVGFGKLHRFHLMFTSGVGGYVGVQTDPTTPDGSVPPPVGFNFAIWDSTESSGDHCGPFGGEGIGHRCTNPATYVPGAEYIFSIERVSFNSQSGEWKWRASVATISERGSESTVIGDIDSLSSAIQINSVGNFEEYFGQMPTLCESIPMTKARFFLRRKLLVIRITNSSSIETFR